MMQPGTKPSATHRVRWAWIGLVALALAACSSPVAPPGVPELVSVQVLPSTGHLEVGQNLQFDAILQVNDGPLDDEGVSWSSSDAAVASVSASGLVTALDVGTATITATADHDSSISGTATLTVTLDLPVTVFYFVDEMQSVDQARLAMFDLQNAHADIVVTDFVGGDQRQAFLDALIGEQPDLAVYLGADLGTPAPAAEALIDWVATGGRLVYSSWVPDAGVLDAMGAGLSGAENHLWTQITDPRLYLGFATSSFIEMNDPGWGQYSVGLTVTADGTSAAVFNNGDDAVIFANGDRTAAVGLLPDALVPLDTTRIFYYNLFRTVLAN